MYQPFGFGRSIELQYHDCEVLQVLNPALEKLLEDSIWVDWDAKLDLLCWQDDELAQFTHKAHKWRTDRAAITRAKKQQMVEAQC